MQWVVKVKQVQMEIKRGRGYYYQWWKEGEKKKIFREGKMLDFIFIYSCKKQYLIGMNLRPQKKKKYLISTDNTKRHFSHAIPTSSEGGLSHDSTTSQRWPNVPALLTAWQAAGNHIQKDKTKICGKWTCLRFDISRSLLKYAGFVHLIAILMHDYVRWWPILVIVRL